MKVDKTFAASVVLHVLVIGWGLVSFSSKAFVSMPEESLPVDIISADQLAKVTAGMKSGKKEVKTPLVEKVAEAKPPAEDIVGKIDDKKPPVVTDTAAPPPPKPDVEKAAAEAAAKAEAAAAKAEAKAAADAKAKSDAKAKAATEAKIEAEALEQAKAEAEAKSAEAKAQADAKAKADAQAKAKADAKAKAEAKARSDADAKAKAEAKAAEAKKAERVFDQSKIAALLDKRDPTRQSVTGETLNSNAALGLSKGKSADNSATWGSMFKEQVTRCWKKPYGGLDARLAQAEFSIKLKPDGTLESMPTTRGAANTPFERVFQESGARAIIACQPYKLPPAFFEEWKFFYPVFDSKDL
ncbi:MAG: Cell division and transport-associated protein TolA [Tardiphaga sp.]|nr:Cell division and transport-associated protein TolA [Tardiphaga sp.]